MYSTKIGKAEHDVTLYCDCGFGCAQESGKQASQYLLSVLAVMCAVCSFSITKVTVIYNASSVSEVCPPFVLFLGAKLYTGKELTSAFMNSQRMKYEKPNGWKYVA